MCQRAEEAEATLRSEWDTFEEARDCLKDDLSRALIAQDAVEAQEQVMIDHYLKAVKVFKYKKYKEGYKDGKRGASLRYPLEIGAFLKSQDQELHESSVITATMAETSSGIPSSVYVPSSTSPPPTAPKTLILWHQLPSRMHASESPF